MDIYSLEQIGQTPKQGCLLMYTRKKVIFEKYDCTGTDIKEYIASKVNVEKKIQYWNCIYLIQNVNTGQFKARHTVHIRVLQKEQQNVW